MHQIKDDGFISNIISDIYGKYKKFMKSNSEIFFDLFSSFKIIDRATEILKNEQSVLEINISFDMSNFVIVGDIHGNLDSLISIFSQNGDPSTTKYLFLGDYVDRGKNSCEVMILLYAFKCLYPENIYLIRGNHEFRDMNDHYGLKDECFNRIKAGYLSKDSYGCQKFYDLVTESFKYLPICAIVNNSIFCVHGGISDLINNRNELMNIKKVGIRFTPNDSVQAEFLWNDPDCEVTAYKKSPRGIGCVFGPKALNSFLDKMNFDIVIRGHQNEVEGYKYPFGKNGGILTIFSSCDYCGCLNDGSFAIISKDNEIDVFRIESNPAILLPSKILENNFDFLTDISLYQDNIIDESSLFF